jgi:RNA 3'-terminal phosphate cyclase-like protein
MVRRVRGVAYGARVAPAMTNRLVDGARGVLNALLADVYIFTDHMAGAEAGASPGFGLALVAETTAGLLLGAQAASAPAVRAHPCPPPAAHRAHCPALPLPALHR